MCINSYSNEFLLNDEAVISDENLIGFNQYYPTKQLKKYNTIH